MTTAQGIEFIRNLLDEPKFEYFGTDVDPNTVFREAMREAATIVARECWHRGEKEALRPLWAETTLTLDATQIGTMPERFLFVESVQSNFQDNADKLWPHKYVSPSVFARRRNRTPFEPSVAGNSHFVAGYYGRAEYTIVGNNIQATSNTIVATPNKSIKVSYIRVPTISQVPTDPMPMAIYMHPTICDKAAEILYRKEHPGDDRPSVGSILDIEGALYKVLRGQAQ